MILNHRLQHAEANSPEAVPTHTTDEPQPRVSKMYGDHPIDYSAFAIVPGQARQERLVTNLAPGRTTIKRYRFPSAGAGLAPGTKMRVGVKELNGTRILNDEVEIQ